MLPLPVYTVLPASPPGAEELTRLLSSLAVDGQVAASAQNQALSALLFLYCDVPGVGLAVDLPRHVLRASGVVTTWTRRSCSARSRRPSTGRGSPSAPAPTRSGIRS